MPSMTIYTTDKSRVTSIEAILSGLRELAAQELSCESRALDKNEISIRVLVPEASAAIADTELEILAYSFPERVARQDNICCSIRDYVQKYCPTAGSVYVWLSLSELGHSSKE